MYAWVIGADPWRVRLIGFQKEEIARKATPAERKARTLLGVDVANDKIERTMEEDSVLMYWPCAVIGWMRKEIDRR